MDEIAVMIPCHSEAPPIERAIRGFQAALLFFIPIIFPYCRAGRFPAPVALCAAAAAGLLPHVRGIVRQAVSSVDEPAPMAMKRRARGDAL